MHSRQQVAPASPPGGAQHQQRTPFSAHRRRSNDSLQHEDDDDHARAWAAEHASPQALAARRASSAELHGVIVYGGAGAGLPLSQALELQQVAQRHEAHGAAPASPSSAAAASRTSSSSPPTADALADVEAATRSTNANTGDAADGDGDVAAMLPPLGTDAGSQPLVLSFARLCVWAPRAVTEKQGLLSRAWARLVRHQPKPAKRQILHGVSGQVCAWLSGCTVCVAPAHAASLLHNSCGCCVRASLCRCMRAV